MVYEKGIPRTSTMRMSWLICSLIHTLLVTQKQCASLEEEHQQLQLYNFVFFQSFWYFLLCTTLGEDALSWLYVGYDVAS